MTAATFGAILNQRPDTIMDFTLARIDSAVKKLNAILKETEKDIKKKMTEQINETRTTTLVFVHDAVTDCEVNIEKAIGDVEERSTGLGDDVEVLDGNMDSLKNMMKHGFDEVTNGRISIDIDEDFDKKNKKG